MDDYNVAYCQSCGRHLVFKGKTSPLARCVNELCRGVLGTEPPKTLGHESNRRGIGQHAFELTENDKRLLRSLRITAEPDDQEESHDDAA